VGKIKESCNRPGVAQRFAGGLGSQISWHLACEGGEVASLTHRPPLPPGMFLVLIFTRGWVDPRAMVWSEGDMSLKNLVAPLGIAPGTVQLVAQCLNHYATPGPCWTMGTLPKNCCILSCVCGLPGSLADCLTAVCTFVTVSDCLMMLPWSWICRPWQVF
jgi:hypothetical protein